MPFAPGQEKPAGSGRQRGGGNRATVAAILDREGCDPIVELVKLAKADGTKPETKARIYAELASYRWPKLRAVEHSGPNGGPLEVQDVSATELLRRRIDSLAARLGPGGDSPRPE